MGLTRFHPVFSVIYISHREMPSTMVGCFYFTVGSCGRSPNLAIKTNAQQF